MNAKLGPLAVLGRWIAAGLASNGPTSPLPETHDWNDQAWLHAIEIANAHRIVPAIGGVLKRFDRAIEMPDDVRDYFDLIYTENAKRNRRLVVQTQELVSALNELGIEPLLLKGAAELMLRRYPDSDMRFVGDIDLLVAARDLERAHGALLKIGYRGGDRSLSLASGQHHLPPLEHPNHSARVELHWTLGRQKFLSSFDPGALITRAARCESVDSRFLVLSSTDAAIHWIYHSQLHHLGIEGEIRCARQLDLVWLLQNRAAEINVVEVERWFALHSTLEAVQVELELLEQLFGVSDQRFCTPTAAARRKALGLANIAQFKLKRRIWRTLDLLRRAYSLERFNRETGGGGAGKFWRWRVARTGELIWRYADLRRVARLSLWFDSKKMLEERTRPPKKR